MADTTPGGAARTGPPPLFTRREKYALSVLSIGFIVLSALTHFTLGAFGERMFPKFKEEATPPPQRVIVQTLLHTPKPTPKPTPTPRPTPTPPPVKNTPPPVNLKIHTIQSKSTSNTGPVEQAYTPPPKGNENGVPTAMPSVEPTRTVATPPPTPAPTAKPTPVYAPQTVVDARFTNKVTPEYPEIAKQQGIQGTCVVLVTIGPDGAVIGTKIGQSSGNPALDQAALTAARQSSYSPPEINGKPATETYKVVYTFSLD